MIRLCPFFAWSLCVSFGFDTMFAQQLPNGATFQAGNVKIEQHNSSLHIHQSTPRAVIDWQSFNVGEGGAVHFMQPSQVAATLNRVVGAGASQILGQITAPGQVFITNGNGVYFGKSASIDVGSMIASSFDIGTSDFMNGDLIFTSQNGREGSISNAGDLKAKENGFIALLAPEVRNEGIIFAKKGSVVLASGEMIELQTDSAKQLVGVRVKPGKWNALVENKKVIEADGGLVVLSAQAESSLFQGLVKNSGVLQAQGIKKDGGRIMLTAGVGGRVKQEGVLDASSEVGRGGLVTVEAEKIELAESSVIDGSGKQGGGNILVGGDWQGGANEVLRVFDDPNAMLQASEVVMKENALIDASASEEGDGGTVVLWADIFNLKSKTFVEGTIYAKGGSNSGDGGKVETSGHFLDINHAKVSTFAPYGKTGDWLLDPGHIVITTSGTDESDGIPASISGTTNIHPTTISTALGSNNLSLATGSGNYDLTVTNGITSSSGNNLTLNAGRNLVVNDPITLGSGTLNLIAGHDMTISANITARSLDFDATDDITVNSYSLITSANNGAINLDANEDLSINGIISSGTGQVTLDGADSLTTGATINSGAISMTTNQNLIINGSINTGSRTISLEANNNLTIAADLTTSNQTASAIRAIAGKNDAAGTATGGDIIISGSPTISVGGTSGRATFFSGDISNSTGLTGLIGSGTNNFRYNADENTDFSSGNWLDLGNGKYAVYREQPTVSLSSISRVYGADLNLAAITVSSGGVNGDTLDSSSLAVDNSIDPEPQPVNYTTHPGGVTYLHARTSYIDGSWTADPYYINSNLRKMGYDVSGGTLSVTRKTVTLVAEKTYDGNNILVNDGVNPDELTIGNLFPGESLTFTDARTSNYHVASVDSHRYVNNITLQNASSGPGDKDNYKTPGLSARSVGNNQVTINKQPLTISLNSATNTTKNYDASTDASVTFSPQYDFIGLVEGDESANVSYESAVYSSANAGTGKTLTISGLVVNFLTETADGSDQSPKSYPTDYEITIGGIPSTTLVVSGVEIAKAPLTVRANDSFKFTGQDDPVGYNGVSYEGFAPDESSSVLSGTLAYNRSATPQAGGAGNTYDLTPSGLVSANYSFNYQNGTFTIVPQNQLVVSVDNKNSTYGDSVTYTLNSVSYYNSGSGTQTVSDGTGAHTYLKSSNQVTVRDHSNDSIVFTVSPASPVNSTGGQLVVGSYTLEATSATNNGSDFDDTVQVIGAHTVAPMELVPTVTAGKIKIYDGDPDMKGLTISVPSIVSDDVAVSGVGTYRSRLDDEDGNLIRWFRDKNVEYDGTRAEAHTTMYNVTDKKYRVENIALTGADASNYRLSTNVLEGTDGRINQRPILYIPAIKTYDGTDFLKTKYQRGSHNDYRFSGGVLPDQMKILDPSDNSSEKLGLVNNERFFYSYGPHEGSGGSIETRNADSGKINNQHVIGADLNKGTNVLPHEVGYNAAVNKTDSHITKVVMQSDPAGSGFLPQNYVLPGENHPSLPGGFDTSNAPVRVNPKDIKIEATKTYDSTPNISSLTLTTDVTNETLQYSSVTTATEHAGALDASGVRSQTYIDNITLSDAADARYTNDASGHNPTGFISDYKFSGQELWNAANKTTITVSPGNTNKNNITINPKPISISGITAADKVYNGNRVATVDATGSSGWIAGDNVTVSATGLFDTKNVNGNELSKTVTLTSTYTGDDKDNYTITDQASTQAKILKRTLGIVATKTYNGDAVRNNNSNHVGGIRSVSGVANSGLVGSERLGYSANLADDDVDGPDDDDTTVDNYVTSITFTNGANGGIANNYIIHSTGSYNSDYNSIDINPREVDLRVLKIYDGTTDLTGDLSVHTGISGEFLNYTGATSNSKDVSDTHYVNAITLQPGPNGEKLSNYSLPNLGAYHYWNNRVDINRKNLTVSGLSSADKIYNGNDVAVVNGTATLQTAITSGTGSDNDGKPFTGNGDNINLNKTTSADGITGQYSNKNIGNRSVSFHNIGLTGTGSGNYNLAAHPTENRQITTNEVRLNSTKIYDGTNLVDTDDTVSIVTSAGENLLFSGAQTAFVNVNDSNNYFTHFTLVDGTGANAGLASNYTLPDLTTHDPTNNSVTINPRNLRIKANNENKTYGTAATLNGVTAFSTVGPNDAYGLQNGETVGSVALTASGGGELASANAGTYTITPSAATGGTFNINNYNVTYATGILRKNKKWLNITGLVALDKVYDATNDASISNYGTLTGILFSDAVSLDTASLNADPNSANFDSKNVGSGKTVTLTLSNSNLIGAAATNYRINNKTTSANITERAITISGITADDKIYDRDTVATTNASGASGWIAGDTVNVSATGQFADKNVGTGKMVSLSSTYGGADRSNYTITDQTSTTADITTKPITISGITASNKIYDRALNATVDVTGASGWIAGDTVTVSATGQFADKNVGTGKIVNLTSTYGGADRSNYAITDQTSTTADITTKPITISGITASNKIYDRALNAAVDVTGASGWIAGDTVTVSTTGQFADKNVGTGKIVNLTSTYGGAESSNYAITDQTSTTADITTKPITISGITASNKIYDRTLNATVDITGASGWIVGDTVTVSASGQFTDKNVGIGKSVGLTSTYSGSDRSNYTITDQISTTADITTKPITISGIVASNKIYDRVLNATVDVTGASGWIAGDTLTVSASGQFADKNVGTGKSVGLTSTYSGADRSNYTITDQTSTTADITVKAITIGGIIASDKIYDNTRTADIVTSGAHGWIDGDDLTVSATGLFSNKNVGTGKTVTLSSGYGGSDRSNYVITDQTIALASITPKAINVIGLTSSDKIYDGTIDATPIGTASFLSGVSSAVGTDNDLSPYLGDDLSVNTDLLVARFNDPNVLIGSHVSFTGLALSGSDANNYNLQNHPDVTNSILPKTVGLSANRIYDATRNLSGNDVTISTGVGSETLNYSRATASSKDVAVSNKYIDAITLVDATDGSGGLASNYQLPSLDAISAPVTISEKTVGLSANRIYDGSKVLTGSDVTITTGVGSETLNYSRATASSKDVAVSNKYIDAVALVDATDGSGGLASNYQLPSLDSINAPVTISAETVGLSASRIYDGSINLTGGDLTITTGVGSETLNYSRATASSKDVAVSNKYINAVTLVDATDGSGGLASNYQLPRLNAVNAPVIVSAKTVGLSANRIYDASRNLSGNDVTISTGVGSETLNYSGGTASSKDVAVSNKYIDAITLVDATDGSGGLASNYQLPSLDSINAPVTISEKTVGLSASKIYDAGVDLTGYVMLSTGVGGETLSYSGATASSKDVAVSNKYIDAVTLVDATDGSGGLASNYKLPALNAINAPVTINTKTVGLTANRIYDGSTVLSGTDVVITTGVGSETLSYSEASASSKDVAESNKYIDAITLVDAVDGTGGLASNYQLPSLNAINAPVSISAKTVGLSASRIYDGSINLTGNDVTISTGVGSETLNYSGATASSKDVAVSNKYIDAITLENALDGSGGLASNYQLPSLDAVNAPVSISVKAVGLSASKIYDAGVDLTGYVTISTGVGSETLNYSGATASSQDVAVSNKYIHTITLVDATNGSGGLASNYKLPSLDAENAPVTITEKTVGLLANRIYDGTRNLSGPDVSITTGVEGETLSYSGATVSSKDVAVAGKHIDAITLENALDGSGGVASNYQLPSLDAVNALVSITPKVVELSASKIYDALLTLTGSDVTIITGVGEETLSYSGATASAKDVVATGNYIDSIILEDAIDQSGGLAGNYLLPSLKVSNAPVNIDPAPLDIQALGEVKTYGREALLDGNLFDVSGLLGQEEIFSVSLQSDGSGRNAALGLYDIVPSDASGPGFDPNNYFIDYLNGVLVVEASPFEQKTALVTLETTQNKVAKTQSSSVETVDTSTFSTITPTSIGPPPPTFITAPPSSLAVPPSIMPSTPVVVPATSVMTPSTPTVIPTVSPTSTPTVALVPEVLSTPSITVESTPTPSPTPTPNSTPLATLEPTPAPTPVPETTSTPSTTAEPASASVPQPTSAPTATAEPASAPVAESTSTPAMSTPGAEALTSTQSNADASGNSSGLTVDLLDSPDTSKVGLIAVSVPKETTALGSGFSFEVPKEVSSISQQQEVSVEVTLETGAPLPSWLNYQEDTGKFTSASVPDGAFPITVIMKIGSQQVAVVISERGE